MTFKLALEIPAHMENYQELKQMYCPNVDYMPVCDIEDHDWLVSVKEKFDRHIKPGEPKNFIKIFWGTNDDLDPVNFDWRVTTHIGDWKILSDKHKHNGLKIKCSDCGNWMLNPDFQTQFNPKSLWKKKAVFSLNSANFYLAREWFVEEFNQQGFTGVTFDYFLEGYYRMEIADHVWNNRSGVCPTCGMKTNVIRESYFNLPEKYLYDIQRLQYNFNGNDLGNTSGLMDQRIVLSSRAMNFLYKHCDPFCNPLGAVIPIMPGHLSDIIWPEDKMFTDGDYPDSVLRKT
jgi:hypothetical protein